MMLGLVTIDEAREHLKTLSTEDDFAIQLKVNAACEVILDYIGSDDTTYATPAAVPYSIKAATLIFLGSLDKDREGDQANGLHLPPLARTLLSAYHDPVVS